MPPRRRASRAEPAPDPVAAAPDRAGAPHEEPPDERVYTYQQKYTRCHKPSCHRCAAGPGHGPYWYAFWWEGGRTRSRYLGKTPPAAPPLPPPLPAEAPAPPPDREPALRVVTLGRFAVWCAGELVPERAWHRRKAASLFKLLVGAPGHRLLRDQVLDQLWPEEDPEVAGASLRGLTHAVRHALSLPDGAPVLEVRDGALALRRDPPPWIDADAFAAAAAAALAGRDLDACRAALAGYGGEYLPDDRYEDWAASRREELAALRIAVLLHQARLCGEEGDMAEACAALAGVLVTDPSHEEAAHRLMTLLAAMGERAEALRVYARLREALRAQYDLEPGEEVASLALRLRTRVTARAPRRAPPATPARHTNLPAAPSTFIGRAEAQEAVRRLLAEERLVTLSGPGGSGKTRLALQVAGALLAAYPDGVWLCELAGLAPAAEQPATATAPTPVAVALAGALGLREEPGAPLVESLCAYLVPRRALLVLDNCEHVLDPSARLAATLLARCPEVRVLVTSQAALGLPREAIWQVPPLDLPAPDHRCTPAQLGAYDAIRLFVERARAARPGFALDEATAPLVLEICRRLDGIPLAIELAAARLAFLALAALAARLDDRFVLLVGGSRIALPRHQTLRAAMDWSYSLLGTKERALLRRLAVFAGGWTLPAAEGLCAGAELPRYAVLDTLGGLVAKSLVTVQGDGASLRYGMLETVRQYGRALLAGHQEEESLRTRHLAWYAQRCEEEIAGWSSTDQAALLRRLDAELENIRAALAWGLEPGGEAAAALRLASALSRYWTTRGLVSEGRRWTARALDAAPGAPAELRATALNRCAILARMEGDSAGAGALWEASLALFRALGDEMGVARVVGNLGLLYYDLGDDGAAIEALSESIGLQRGHPGPHTVAEMLLNRSMVYTRQHRYAEADAGFAEALAYWRAVGDRAAMSSAYVHTAHLARDQGQLDRAAWLYSESLRISLELDARPLMPPALEGIAHVLLHRCETGTAARAALDLSTRLFACGAALRESTNVPLPAASRAVYHPDLQRLQALLGPAAFETAWAAGWEAPVLSLVEQVPL